MKTFNNEQDEENYNNYIELLNQPYKLQSLLYHTHNIPNKINYNDIYEDEEKICISNNNYTVRIGNSSLYLKPINKYGFTFNKKGNSNSRLKLWYGTSNNNILNILITTKDIFNFELTVLIEKNKTNNEKKLIKEVEKFLTKNNHLKEIQLIRIKKTK